MTVNSEGRPEQDVESYGDAVERVTARDEKSAAESLALNVMETIVANIDNENLSDEEFRSFVRNSTKWGNLFTGQFGENDDS